MTGPDGQPVSGVAVRAYADSDTWFPSASTTTGADGSYVLAAIPPGTYRVVFVPPVSSGLRSTWDGSPTNRWAATPHSITPGTALDVDAHLVAVTAVTGTVTGPGGVGVAGARVSAYDADDRYVGTVTTTTGADGSYRLASMPANTYRVLVSPPAGSGLAARWYVSSSLRSTATQIVVDDATVVSGIDVALG